MESLRKWFYRPRKDDPSLLAQFFYADEALNLIACELDSFDGRKDPERCTSLVNQLRQSQDKVLTITNMIMDRLIGDERANRDFRVKFPEDVLQDNLAGQLWFGAECLAAGSSIMNRESESAEMRPLAKALTHCLESLRNLLRDMCLRNSGPPTEHLIESLKIFDRLFADFELKYVSAMVPVKSVQEHELQELIGVLFSETLQRALEMKLLTQDRIDDCDPALMFTIPRLAIVSGLVVYPHGPLAIDRSVDSMSEMFRPFRNILKRIREELVTLDPREVYRLERLLCDNDEDQQPTTPEITTASEDCKQMSVGIDDDFVARFYAGFFGTEDVICQDNDNNKLSDSHPLTINIAKLVNTPSPHHPPRNKPSRTINIPSTSSAASTLLSPSSNANNTNNDTTSATEAHNHDNDGNPAGPGNVVGGGGFLLTNALGHDNLVVTDGDVTPPELRNGVGVQAGQSVDSLPDRDSLQVISVAAAALTSILNDDGRGAVTANVTGDDECTEVAVDSERKDDRVMSAAARKDDSAESATDDSGICTENTSLDRSPSLELTDCNTGHGGNVANQQTPRAAPSPPAACDKCTMCCCCCGCCRDAVSAVNCDRCTTKRTGRHHRDSASKTTGGSGRRRVSLRRSGAASAGKVRPPTTDTTTVTPEKSPLNVVVVQGDEGDSASIGSSETTSSFHSTCADDDEVVAGDDGGNNEDDDAITLAMQVALIGIHRFDIRSKDRSQRNDLIHRLYVCIAGVADQLQTNYAADLRNILKAVFLINASPDTMDMSSSATSTTFCTQQSANNNNSRPHSSSPSIVAAVVDNSNGSVPTTPNGGDPVDGIMDGSTHSLSTSTIEYHPTTTEIIDSEEFTVDPNILAQEALFDSNVYFHLTEDEEENDNNRDGGRNNDSNGQQRAANQNNIAEETTTPTIDRPPTWVPDVQAPKCMACAVNFTVVKRRHHCRNCGKVFCARCSANSAPLPKYGHMRPVRVCNRCFLYNLSPFTR